MAAAKAQASGARAPATSTGSSERNSDDFVSMATAAGAPDGVERGVYVRGANYKNGDFSIGAIDYYSDDIINIFYAETKYAIPLGDDTRLQFAAQYTDQRSIGDDLLRGADFSAHQWGGKAELAFGGALFTAGYTSAGDDTDMQNPWSSYPGYTSVQVDDFNRDGEDAWMLRAAYTFQSMKGLSVYALRGHGLGSAGSGSSPATNTTSICSGRPGGPLKGLMLRLRYAVIDQELSRQSGI